MTHHPHTDMIVPDGGLSMDDSRWISCKPNFLLPVRVLSKLFRRLMLEKLLAAHEAGSLRFLGSHAHLADAKAFAALLASLWKKRWFVYAKRPFAGPKAVLAYLSRYTHRRSPALCRCASAGLPNPIRAHVLGPNPTFPDRQRKDTAIERFCQAEHDGPPDHSRNGIMSKMPIAATGLAPSTSSGKRTAGNRTRSLRYERYR
jgi:hypothetical protein